MKLLTFKGCQRISGFAVKRFFAKRFIDEHMMFRLAAHVVNAAIDGDAVEPRVELGGAFEDVKALVGFEKHLLGEVERVLGVGDNGEDDAVNAGVVAVIEFVENALIAGLEAGYEDGIGWRVRVLDKCRHERWLVDRHLVKNAKGMWRRALCQ